MKFGFIQVKSLPPLSWCALLSSDSETVCVYCGSMVETKEDSFFEGAWDGPFEDRQFHRAMTFTGSGGVLTEEGPFFASATNSGERLYSVRLEQHLYISNSLIFLMAQMDDEPDPQIAHYYFDFLESFRRGPASKPQSIKTRRGRHIKLHPCCNLLVGQNFAIHYRPKRNSEAPRNYAEYCELLEGTVERIFVNAAHPNRLHSYQPVTTITQGYDSVAVAALAVKGGCREAVTFTSVDDARAISEVLGLVTKEYDLTAFQQLPDYPEAEFCALPFGSSSPYGSMESELKGKLLLTGFLGDRVWCLTPDILSNLRQPWRPMLEGNTLIEFRLRVGFFLFPLPYVGALNARKIHQITRSRELKPWSIGGGYNRPIPRRIAEDAGVPRQLFGQRKVAGSHSYPHRSHGLSEKSRNDFVEYCKRHSVCFSNLRPNLVRCILGFAHSKLCASLKLLPHWMMPLILPLTWLRFRNYNNLFWRSEYLYTFHWGINKVRHRYFIPEDIKDQYRNDLL
jgi:hypothetical protein